ncbi:CapA family protein [Streptomyces noursei]|uniref:CapA family protein n=1 Tax=Streptomyces noursei TaxID=1971 RepID=UPI0035DDFA6B
MSAFTRYATAVLLVGLAVGCGARPDDPPRAPRSTPPPAERRPDPPAPPHRARPADAAPARSFTLVATGDVIPAHPDVLDTARDDAPVDGGYDFRPMLRGVAPVVTSADLALCDLEAPLGPLGGPFTGYPELQAPPQIATALKATGFDSCATASSHALDQGEEGVRRTLEALDTVGLRHTGTARNPAEATRPALLRAPGGALVAHLAYTNDAEGGRPPEDAPWMLNPLDPARIVADARAARRAGADVVVVSPYWGTEYRTAPDARQLRLAHLLAAARTDGRPDIDLIVGSRAHTPQPFEKVGGTWVVYGLGDQLAGVMTQARGDWGAAARFRFAPPARPGGRWRVTRAEYVPLLTDVGPPVRALDLTRTRGHDDVRKEIDRAVLSRGAADDGLVRRH